MTTSAVDDIEQQDDTVTTPIKRKSVLEMKTTELTELVEGIRQRRLSHDSLIQRARKKNSTKRFEALHNKTEIAISQALTQHTRINGAMDKLDTKLNQIRVMLLEMGEYLSKDGSGDE